MPNHQETECDSKLWGLDVTERDADGTVQTTWKLDDSLEAGGWAGTDSAEKGICELIYLKLQKINLDSGIRAHLPSMARFLRIATEAQRLPSREPHLLFEPVSHLTVYDAGVSNLCRLAAMSADLPSAVSLLQAHLATISPPAVYLGRKCRPEVVLGH